MGVGLFWPMIVFQLLFIQLSKKECSRAKFSVICASERTSNTLSKNFLKTRDSIFIAFISKYLHTPCWIGQFTFQRNFSLSFQGVITNEKRSFDWLTDIVISCVSRNLIDCCCNCDVFRRERVILETPNFRSFSWILLKPEKKKT